MASQISHIVYAKKYFDSLDLAKMENLTDEEKLITAKGELNRDEFILGCVFPDIRRIDSRIERSKTHLKFVTLDLDFSGLTSFEAGWKFHLYCDMRREDILNKYKFYSLNNAGDLYGTPAKHVEDEIVYDEYNNWEKIGLFFNNPPYFETNIGIAPETFRLWYAILAKYIEKKPDEKAHKIYFSKNPSLVKYSKDIVESMSKLRENKKAVEILKKVKEEII